MSVSEEIPAQSTRDALMAAALDQLAMRGVLSGLNLREVAESVGITAANIYHLFGSRQGLLRAALSHEVDAVFDEVAESSDKDYLTRALVTFDAITSRPLVRLTALLAIDGDPEYEPLPYIRSAVGAYRDMVDAGELPPDLDIEATHLVGLSASIGVALYLEAVARQLDQPVDGLRERARNVFATMMASLLQPAPSPTGSAAGG